MNKIKESNLKISRTNLKLLKEKCAKYNINLNDYLNFIIFEYYRKGGK